MPVVLWKIQEGHAGQYTRYLPFVRLEIAAGAEETGFRIGLKKRLIRRIRRQNKAVAYYGLNDIRVEKKITNQMLYQLSYASVTHSIAEARPRPSLPAGLRPTAAPLRQRRFHALGRERRRAQPHAGRIEDGVSERGGDCRRGSFARA